MLDDVHDRRAPCRKTLRPAHPAERCEPRALCRPAQHRAHPTSEKFLPDSLRIQSRRRGRIAPERRSIDPTPAVPAPAKHRAHPISCCRFCFAHPHRGSGSAKPRWPPDRATPASTCRHLHRRDAPLPASSVQLCSTAKACDAARQFPDPAEVLRRPADTESRRSSQEPTLHLNSQSPPRNDLRKHWLMAES